MGTKRRHNLVPFMHSWQSINGATSFEAQKLRRATTQTIGQPSHWKELINLYKSHPTNCCKNTRHRQKFEPKPTTNAPESGRKHNFRQPPSHAHRTGRSSSSGRTYRCPFYSKRSWKSIFAEIRLNSAAERFKINFGAGKTFHGCGPKEAFSYHGDHILYMSHLQFVTDITDRMEKFFLARITIGFKLTFNYALICSSTQGNWNSVSKTTG